MSLLLVTLGQGSSRTSQGSESPPGWGSAGSGVLQPPPPPPLTPAPDVKRPVQAARKETKEPKKVTHSPQLGGAGGGAGALLPCPHAEARRRNVFLFKSSQRGSERVVKRECLCVRVHV